jgi:hypothetical protein
MSANAQAIYRSIAKANDITLPAEVETTIVQQLDTALRYDGTEFHLVDQNGNRATTIDASGKPIDIGFDEFVRDLVKALPAPEAKPQTANTSKDEKPAGKPINLTERMRTMLEERKSDAAEIATSIVANPWHRDSLNLTHQSIIARADPVRAERLKAAAKEVSP